MTAYIVGFIIAVMLAAFAICWIAYCMFVRERHKSERYHYDVSDLKKKNYEIMTVKEDKRKTPTIQPKIKETKQQRQPIIKEIHEQQPIMKEKLQQKPIVKEHLIKHSKRQIINTTSRVTAKKEFTAGIIIIPTRHKQHTDEDYSMRPDYPESPVPVVSPSTNMFTGLSRAMVDSGADSIACYEHSGLEISRSYYQSDV